MSRPITQSNNKIGLCPHGLPIGACPICNGQMGMGGSGRSKDMPKTTKPINNQWSYMKCYSVGMAMRERKLRAIEAKEVFARQLKFAENLKISINNMCQRIKENIQKIQNSSFTIINKAINVLNNLMITPVLNMISQLPKIIEKFTLFERNIYNFIQNVSEKITALLGDIKNFIERNFSEKIKKSAKKFFLFFIPNNENENYKNDETLNIFKSREIKKYIVKILNFKNKREEDK